uniref:receptor protein-tyrosine kinase n=2 Tax=Bactrocera latifrons TaxID=174628 RepID=A0A0K8WF29_BACLA
MTAGGSSAVDALSAAGSGNHTYASQRPMAYQVNLPATLRCGSLFALLLALILQALIPRSAGALVNADTLNADVAGNPLAFTSNTPPEPSQPPRTCNSIEVRTRKDFELLKNCTRVHGHVWLALLQLSPNDVGALKYLTEVEEITDYLLVHRVHGLPSLHHIFPHLRIIRGRRLLFDEFALVIYENRDLRYLGLGSLLRIQAGNIRIETNPSLCYVDTVNWVQLLGNSSQQHFWHKNNKLFNHCTQCERTNNQILVEEDLPNRLRKHCWGYDIAQERPATNNVVNCRTECGLRGCDDNGNCCDPNCLSDCDGKRCSLCANLKLERQCVDKCPQNYYQHQDRDCISASKCRQLGSIPFARICMEKCPRNYLTTVDADGNKMCKLQCIGTYTIHTTADAESLQGCSKINGSLIIELTDIKTKITDLDNAFANITEITGYLKVVNSPQLLTLHFLRNLVTIRGDELVNDLYALVAVDNYHLSEIWTPNQNVAILKGSIYFHLNPRLCLSKIRELQKSLKSAAPITTVNASPHSNGERVICNNPITNFTVTLEDYNSTAARLKIDIFTLNNIQIILGYVYYYKETPVQNVTLYDGRHGCGHDNWHMKVNPTKNIRYIITNLKPYTQYAYFVKTLTMTDYHIRMDAYSKIQYFRTLPSKPGPVKRIYYTAIAMDKIVLHWWPPRKPNGIIEKYIINLTNYEKSKIAKDNVTLGNYRELRKYSPSCDCVFENPEDSGPLPSDENYYRREQIIYEETLPNLIFVSRRIDNVRVRRNADTNHLNGNTNCVGRQSLVTPNTINSYLDNAAKHIRVTRKIADSEAKSKDNNNNKLEEQMNKDDHDLEEEQRKRGEASLLWIIHQQEEQARRLQDTGPDDFPIIKRRPVCPIPDASTQYQLQNNCRPLEIYKGIVTPGNIHSYTLTDLEPEQTYRITIRACVANLPNGCGDETSIFAETVSKSMEEFLEGLRIFD